MEASPVDHDWGNLLQGIKNMRIWLETLFKLLPTTRFEAICIEAARGW
jgi:hypothetical protein